MNNRSLKIMIFLSLIVGCVFVASCDVGNEIIGSEYESVPPTTQLLNIPTQDNIDHPYDAILRIGWKGISKNGIIKGYWVSIKSYFMSMKDSVVQEIFYTEEMTMEIPLPSADTLNKHIIKVVAVDNKDIKDPVGATGTYYTKQVIPPSTQIIFPENNSEVFLLDQTNYLWKGIRIDAAGTTGFGVIQDYSYKVNNGEWSEWTTDSTFYLNKSNHPSLTAGKNKVLIRARNSAFSFDETPYQLDLELCKSEKTKDWLIIDDTKDQKGSLEKPDDMQVDQFYQELLSNETYDEWDLNTDGPIKRSVIGNYKYVLWHSDANRETNVAENAGVLMDYLNTGGNLYLTGWNNFDILKTPDKKEILSKTAMFHGDFIKDYAHVTSSYNVKEARVHTILDDRLNTNEADLDKLFSFRKGIYKVDVFTELKPFTTPLFVEAKVDSNGVTTPTNNILGYAYHNSIYKMAVTGFPLYFLKTESAKKVFGRVKEYFETNFPY